MLLNCHPALECIDHLSDSLDFSEYSSLIVHPLTRDAIQCCREIHVSYMIFHTSILRNSLAQFKI